MTDLESPRKNNDCYFYYYSTCAKGDSCTFRHEPSALGCETMCSFWKEGKCLNVHCNYRHMELRKNRKAIACYWESQPGGCLKQHCPFMHQNKSDPESPEKTDSNTEKQNNERSVPEKCQKNDVFKNSGVDSLVVNFEEESDSESMPSHSPLKHPNRQIKTLDEIKLEKIQAEAAAYYSYGAEQSPSSGDDLRKRIMERLSIKAQPPIDTEKRPAKRNLEVESETKHTKKQKKNEPNVNEIKIKTLAEIRAERNKRIHDQPTDAVVSKRKHSEIVFNDQKAVDETEVSSTSLDEDVNKPAASPPKKLKLRRRPLIVEESEKTVETVSNSVNNERGNNEKLETDQSRTSDRTECKPLGTDQSDFSKTMDEVLLLEDDEDDSNVSIRAEDDLLNEIDSILDE
ncbi:zinc finger CCCH domain-containing protein 11A isoform X2 [Aethina tumida]|nr:zinc finger CCCH domain-containing protein 11A isoform X2 [Aethina tumida]XP_049825501.1 zinc finger CCCH domain-containing protein 11A isoform X2 [Aethina tumida]